MLLMLHVDKVHSRDGSRSRTENSNPPIDWCTRETGESSDHVIVILDCERLVKKLLPAFQFPPTSLASFVRKLFRWGFRQVSETYEVANKSQPDRLHTSSMYECPYFQKGNFALLRHMSSHTAAGARRKVAAQQHDSTELAHQVDGVNTQGNQISQYTSNHHVPANRMVGRSLPRTARTNHHSPCFSPPAGLVNLGQNPAFHTGQQPISTEHSGPAAVATFRHLQSNPSRQRMVPSLSPVPTPTVAMQYSMTMNELAHIEREQLQLANEQIRLQQLRRTSHTKAGNTQSAAIFAHHVTALGPSRGNSSLLAMSPINLAGPPATSTELSLNHGTSTSGVTAARGIPGLSQGSVHSQPRSLHNAGNQSPFLPSFFSSSPPPSLTLDSMTTGVVDWSNPTLRHGAALEAARIQREILTRSIDPAMDQRCKLAASSQQGVSAEQIFLMQHQQQQQLHQEISSLKSQLALSPSFGPTRGSAQQTATMAVEELGESQEKTLHASHFGPAKDGLGTE
jgi:HSF-type DNA-binding